MPSYPINVTTVSGKGSPLNAVEFDSNLTTLKDAVNDLHDNKLDSSTYTASDVLTKIKTVDGSGSGLDADTVDGIQASSFLRSDTGEMNLSGITFQASLGNRIIKSIGAINDAKAGVILFAKVYSGTYLPKQGFVGKLFVDRGGTVSFNISYEYDVVCTTAYSSSILTLTGNHPNCYLVKVNYNGEDYYGVYSEATSARRIILDGFIYNYDLDGNGNPYIFIPDASGYTVTKVDSTQIYNNQNQVYTQSNILGTVSQSGGVPTGAIIETGSNANGEYVRFANGTQIATNSNNAITTSPATFTGTITKIDNNKLWIGRWY
jgi:hypothetical protein